MLHVTLEVCTPPRTVIGSLDIQDDGTGTPAEGNYRLTLWDANGVPLEQDHLYHFMRDLGAWVLVRKALNTMVLGRQEGEACG